MDSWRFSPPPQPLPVIDKAVMLNPDANHSVLAIVAPGGYGKTTLSAQLYQRWPDGKVWISTSTEGIREVDLATVLVRGCAKVVAHEQTLIQRIEKAMVDDPIAIIPPLIRALTKISRPILLVLDDIPPFVDDKCLEAINTFIRLFPRQHQLVLTTRNDQMLHLSTLYLSGQAKRISSDDLKFNAGEVHAFLAHFDIDRASVATISQQIDGWPAAARLISVSYRTSGLPSNPIDTRQMIQFFFNEIISGLPKDAIELMQISAIAPRFTREFIDFVSENSNANEIQRLLELQLLTKQSGAEEWYCFHSLLRQSLHVMFSANKSLNQSRIYQRAAEWWLMNAHPWTAVEYAIQSANKIGLAEMLSVYGWQLYQMGYHSLLKTALAALPVQLIVESSSLIIVAFKTHLVDDVVQAKYCLEMLSTRLGLPHLVVDTTSQIYAVHACLRVTLALHQCSRNDLAIYAPIAYQNQSSLPDSLVPSAVAGYAEYHWLSGDIDQAIALWNDAAQLAIQREYIVDTLWHKHLIASAYFHQGKMQLARAMLIEAIELAEYYLIRYQNVLWCIYRTKSEVELYLGDWHNAELALSQAEEIASHWGESYQLPCLLLREQLSAARHTNSYQASALTTQKIARLAGIFYHHPFSKNRADQWLLQTWAQAKNISAISLWRHKQPQLKTLHSVYDIHLLRNQAIAAWLCHEQELAKEIVERALNFASKINVGLEHFQCLKAFHTITGNQDIHTLINQMETFGINGDIHIDQYFWSNYWHVFQPKTPPLPLLTPPLSKTEIAMLHGLINGLSNKELAQSMCLAKGTIKNRLTRLYRRLDVETRKEAIAWASKHLAVTQN